MTTREALSDYFEREGIKTSAQNVEQWLGDNWLRFSVFGRRVPVKPLYGFKRALALHDVHHLLTGYDTTWTGEFQVTAWEIGSGGCAPHVLFWLKLVFTSLLGLLLMPTASWYAFARGRAERNLFRCDLGELLGREVDDLRAYAAGAGGPASLRAVTGR
jgi:hypothetical protein